MNAVGTLAKGVWSHLSFTNIEEHRRTPLLNSALCCQRTYFLAYFPELFSCIFTKYEWSPRIASSFLPSHQRDAFIPFPLRRCSDKKSKPNTFCIRLPCRISTHLYEDHLRSTADRNDGRRQRTDAPMHACRKVLSSWYTSDTPTDDLRTELFAHPQPALSVELTSKSTPWHAPSTRRNWAVETWFCTVKFGAKWLLPPVLLGVAITTENVIIFSSI